MYVRRLQCGLPPVRRPNDPIFGPHSGSIQPDSAAILVLPAGGGREKEGTTHTLDIPADYGLQTWCFSTNTRRSTAKNPCVESAASTEEDNKRQFSDGDVWVGGGGWDRGEGFLAPHRSGWRQHAAVQQRGKIGIDPAGGRGGGQTE